MCDYGLVIPHHDTIVVGNTNRIGPYAVLHTSTCITGTGRKIGKGLSLSIGAKITVGEVWGVTLQWLQIRLLRGLSLMGILCLLEWLHLQRRDIPNGIQVLQRKRRVDEVEKLKRKMKIE